MTEKLVPKMTREDAYTIRQKVQREPILIRDVDPSFALYYRAYECIDIMDRMQEDYNHYQRRCKVIDLVKHYWMYKTNLCKSDPWLDNLYAKVLTCIIENLTGALPF